ncbi:MAG: hypothetical protein AB1458_07295 [Bacteroidota bacterium]
MLAAQNTAESGRYEVSRLPGHPLQEFVYLLNPYGSYFYYNLLSAAFSTLAVLFFALLLRRMAVRHYLAGALALAFTPVFYTSSTYTIDYAWSLAFVMASLYCLAERKIVLAGILLGMAVGCRITSAAMLLPFLLLAYERSLPLRKNLAAGVLLAGSAALTALLLFIPILHRYGPGFFMYYDQFDYPPFAKIAYKATLGVFGLVGMLGLAYGAALIVRNRFRPAEEVPAAKKWIRVSLLVFLLYIIAYLRLPQKSGYMIPLIPFAIILLACFLGGRQFRIACFMLILSPFILGINLTDPLRGSRHSPLAARFTVSGQEIFFDPLTGPVAAEYSKRWRKLEFTDKVIAAFTSGSEKCIVISGWWYNEIAVKLKQRGLDAYAGNFVFYINKGQIDSLRSAGHEICYLPEQDIYNDQYSKMNYTARSARPLRIPE